MSFPQTIALGALAGLTIYIGLPMGRLQLLDRRGRVATAMFAVGVLSFIFVDVLSNGLSIVSDALQAAREHRGSAGYVVELVVLLFAGFTVGSAGLALLERRIRPLGARRPPIAGGATAVALGGTETEARGGAAACAAYRADDCRRDRRP
jgi:ZIP family zinc transporter